MSRVDFKVREHEYSFYYETTQEFVDAILDMAESHKTNLTINDCFQVIGKLDDRIKAKGIS